MKAKKSRGKNIQPILVDFFLGQDDKYFSFKQLKKKFERIGGKELLYNSVQALVVGGFLEEQSNQYRRATKAKPATTESKHQDRAQNIVEGKVDMTASGAAYIIPEGGGEDIRVEKNNLLNALDGDKVKVLLVKKKKGRREGRIIEIVERGRQTFVGTVRKHFNQYIFSADDKNMNVDFIIPEGKLLQAKNGDKVLLRFVQWQQGTPHPAGEVLKVLGKAGEHETEMQSILLEFGFHLEFPASVIKEAEVAAAQNLGEEISSRKDFRNTTTFTIDPADAKDFDDALSFVKLEDGLYEVGVHIADVSHFVKPNTTLDKEAEERGTSVYLVDRCVPMLPEQLSNGVCSLSPDEDKLCFSCVFKMNEAGVVKNYWIGKTVIHSNHRFSYDEAQEVLEGKESEFAEALLALNVMAKTIREQRFKSGSVDFDTQEIKFLLDEDNRPVSVFVKGRKDAHKLIEEFMLLANKSVSEFISKKKGKKIPFVYRIHDLPNEEKLKDFAELALFFGYKLSFDTPKQIAHSLNKLLKKIQGKPEQYMLETLAIRTMAKAVYSTDNIGHYGLGFEHYSHFTSPIRRYPDLMAHRILEKVLNHEQVVEPNLQVRCDHASQMERQAADAERLSVKLKQVEYLEGQEGNIFDAIVSGVVEWGIFVLTVDSFCEGAVRLNSIRSDHFIYEDRKHRVKGMRTGKKIQLGDKVRVKLLAVNKEKKTLDFLLAE